MKRRLAALFCVGSLSAPTPASAHLVGVEFGDFYAGALHLLSAPEHVVALVAIALVAALHPRDDARWALLALPIGFIIGALAAWWTPLAAPAAALIAASLAAPGAIGAFARPMTARFLAGGVAIIAGLLGFAMAGPARAGGVYWPL